VTDADGVSLLGRGPLPGNAVDVLGHSPRGGPVADGRYEWERGPARLHTGAHVVRDRGEVELSHRLKRRSA
jgi:hypothetical protein